MISIRHSSVPNHAVSCGANTYYLLGSDRSVSSRLAGAWLHSDEVFCSLHRQSRGVSQRIWRHCSLGGCLYTHLWFVYLLTYFCCRFIFCSIPHGADGHYWDVIVLFRPTLNANYWLWHWISLDLEVGLGSNFIWIVTDFVKWMNRWLIAVDIYFFVISHDSEMVSILVTNLCKLIFIRHCTKKKWFGFGMKINHGCKTIPSSNS